MPSKDSFPPSVQLALGPIRGEFIGHLLNNDKLDGPAGKVVEFMTRITVTGLALEETAVAGWRGLSRR